MSENERARVRTPAYVALCLVAALSFATVSFGALLEGGSWSWPGAIAVAVPLALAARASAFSVDVGVGTVTVRTLLRTRRVPRASITEVGTHAYDGFWTRGSESPTFRTVRIEAGDRSCTASGLVGRRRAVQAAADQLCALLDLPHDPKGQLSRRTTQRRRPGGSLSQRCVARSK